MSRKLEILSHSSHLQQSALQSVAHNVHQLHQKLSVVVKERKERNGEAEEKKTEAKKPSGTSRNFEDGNDPPLVGNFRSG